MAKASDEVALPQTGLSPFESRLLNLFALMLVNDRQQAEQIDLLTRAGFRPLEIAGLLDTSANNVSVRLAEMRRAKKKSKPKTSNRK
jgi:hypothetical protein